MTKDEDDRGVKTDLIKCLQAVMFVEEEKNENVSDDEEEKTRIRMTMDKDGHHGAGHLDSLPIYTYIYNK